jgi:hypothetical protein
MLQPHLDQVSVHMHLRGIAAAAAELATQYIASFQDSRIPATPSLPLMSLVQLLVVLLWMLLLC